MKAGSSFKKNADGIWEKDGVLFPLIVRIKADKCLKDDELRKNFHPNTFVYFHVNLIFTEDLNNEETLYFALVKKVDDEDRNDYPIPLCMLDLSGEQKAEIIKSKHFPKKALEKTAIIKDVSFFDEGLVNIMPDEDETPRSYNFLTPGAYGFNDLRFAD